MALQEPESERMLAPVSDSGMVDMSMSRRPQDRNTWLRPRITLVVIHLVILTTWVGIAASLSNRSTCFGGNTYSPAGKVLRVEEHVWAPSGESNDTYAGKPTDTLDKAWSELLQYSDLRFTAEEMDKIGRARRDEGVELPDGGYLGTLTVFHELHCIKHLRYHLYSSHYFPPLSPKQTESRRIHLDHCLDLLRAGAMCRADVAPLTMRWGHTQPRPLANFSGAHSCINWESLYEWARGRAVPNLFEPGYLRHPVLGNVFDVPNATLTSLIGAVEDS